jgi:hypothetical protein
LIDQAAFQNRFRQLPRSQSLSPFDPIRAPLASIRSLRLILRRLRDQSRFHFVTFAVLINRASKSILCAPLKGVGG